MSRLSKQLDDPWRHRRSIGQGGTRVGKESESEEHVMTCVTVCHVSLCLEKCHDMIPHDTPVHMNLIHIRRHHETIFRNYDTSNQNHHTSLSTSI